MLEGNMHRLLMMIGGVFVVGAVVVMLMGDGSDDGSESSKGFLGNTTEQLIEQNQRRTPKY